MAENNNSQHAKRLYYSVIDGELRRKANPEDNQEYVKKRTRKDGVEVTEYVPSSISGNVSSFEIKTEDFQGKKISKLNVTLTDIGEEYLIQFPVESRYFGSFVSKLPNVNFANPVEISVYDFIDKSNKKVAGVTVKQGSKITDYFTKDNPLPGVSAYPFDGDDDEKKLWGIQRTKALKAVVIGQYDRLKSDLVVGDQSESNSDYSEDIPF
jgi:hypothetical protein